ncbi:hypothetical protein Tco_0441213 [Tanacetum coccineum]
MAEPMGWLVCARPPSTGQTNSTYSLASDNAGPSIRRAGRPPKASKVYGHVEEARVWTVMRTWSNNARKFSCSRKKEDMNKKEDMPWKRISDKKTKNKAKNDKTEHGMEKCEKTKPNRSQKVNQVKKSSEKSNSQSQSQPRQNQSQLRETEAEKTT